MGFYLIAEHSPVGRISCCASTVECCLELRLQMGNVQGSVNSYEEEDVYEIKSTWTPACGLQEKSSYSLGEDTQQKQPGGMVLLDIKVCQMAQFMSLLPQELQTPKRDKDIGIKEWLLQKEVTWPRTFAISDAGVLCVWLKDILDQALCTAPCIFSSSRPVSTLSTQQAQGPRATSTACASRRLLAAWRLQSPSTSSTGSPGPEMCCQGKPVMRRQKFRDKPQMALVGSAWSEPNLSPWGWLKQTTDCKSTGKQTRAHYSPDGSSRMNCGTMIPMKCNSTTDFKSKMTALKPVTQEDADHLFKSESSEKLRVSDGHISKKYDKVFNNSKILRARGTASQFLQQLNILDYSMRLDIQFELSMLIDVDNFFTTATFKKGLHKISIDVIYTLSDSWIYSTLNHRETLNPSDRCGQQFCPSNGLDGDAFPDSLGSSPPSRTLGLQAAATGSP
ncbi:hypothetical protein U0070_009897 [Myodes glareolus]|uniref:Uncharacterized protein n=1 Tax=Myodes glareolus TaxID=447135 RepID=A0AAW0JIV9_MYOGA